jgi:MFS family permease
VSRTDEQRTTFGSVLSLAEFRWLWLASVQSLVGDLLARVALAVLVYDRTGSGLWTAATYAVAFLPAVVGGLFLAGLADRFPRRRVVVTCDLLRAALFFLMAAPGLPLGLVVALLVVATLVGTVFQAAEPALVADMFTGRSYTTALGLRTVTFQSAQLVGFGVGGVVAAAVGPRAALAVDAGTFVASAMLLRFGLSDRRVAQLVDDGRRGARNLLGGVRLVARNRSMRLLIGFACLTAAWVIPQGLSAPYAAQVGGGAAATGLLMAANPAGNVLGAVLFSRLTEYWQRRLLGPLAVLAGVPLIACLARPGLADTMALWAAAGVCTSCMVQVNAEYIGDAPKAQRGRAIGVLGAAIVAGQGFGLLIGGALTQAMTPAVTVAVAGVAAVVAASGLTIVRTRSQTGIRHDGIAHPVSP